METLERHAGHFYNWYDTQTKAPLTRAIFRRWIAVIWRPPVDIARRSIGSRRSPIIGEQIFPALADTLQILEKTAGGAASDALAQFENALTIAAETGPMTVASVRADLGAAGYVRDKTSLARLQLGGLFPPPAKPMNGQKH